MLAYFLRRVLLTVPVLFGIATLVFALVHLVPGDPAVSMLGEGATGEDVAALRARLGLDEPLPAQYWAFLKGAVRARPRRVVPVESAGDDRNLHAHSADDGAGGWRRCSWRRWSRFRSGSSRRCSKGDGPIRAR